MKVIENQNQMIDCLSVSEVSIEPRRTVQLKDVTLSARRLLIVVFLAVIFTGAARPITDPDFWWHLRTGQYLVETRSIPHTDIFSVSHFGREWVAHEWLAEAFIYSIYRLLGYGGLIVVFALIITLAFWIVFRICSQRCRHPYVSGFALVIGAMATLPTWGVRPQMFSLLFASVFLHIIDGYTRKGEGRKLWWLVPVMLCWVNLHAGFALGLTLIFLSIVGLVLDGLLAGDRSLRSIWQRIFPLCLVGIMCLAAVACNPNGLRMYSYPFETLKSQAMMKYISEWWSPNFHEPMFQPFALLIFATFGALALSPKRVRLGNLLLLVVMGWAGLKSARNVPFFALVAIPLLAEHAWFWLTSHSWGRWLTKPEKQEMGRSVLPKIAFNIALLVAAPCALAALRVVHSVEKQPQATAQQFPVAAVDFILATRPAQPFYNEYGWGGYLIWRLYPDYRIYIDGRADVFGDAFLEEFLATHEGEARWREPLDRIGVRTVIIKPEAALASLLRQEPDWVKVFEDSQAIVFARR